MTLPPHDRQGVRLDPLAYLRTLQVGQCGHWPVWVKADGPRPAPQALDPGVTVCDQEKRCGGAKGAPAYAA